MGSPGAVAEGAQPAPAPAAPRPPSGRQTAPWDTTRSVTHRDRNGGGDRNALTVHVHRHRDVHRYRDRHRDVLCLPTVICRQKEVKERSGLKSRGDRELPVPQDPRKINPHFSQS